MTLWHIAWNYLWNRKLTTGLTILSVALGVGLITAVLILRDETERRFVEEGQAFDVAVGAEGSTQQLVLSTVYFIGQPAGNIPYEIYEQLQKDEDVERAFPIGLGDSFRGFRLVGTSADMLKYDWVNRITGEPRNTFRLREDGKSRHFEKPFEAVLGSAVAQQSGLQVGDTFVSTHGLMHIEGAEAHEDMPYTVVGILRPSGTPNDRAIFCDLASIWHVHEHEYGTASLTGADTGTEADVDEHAAEEGEDHAEEHHEHHDREVTSVLLVLKSPGLRFQFMPRIAERYPDVIAAIPVDEIQKLYRELLGTARQVLLAIGYLVVVISSISILIGLYLSIIQRKRDLAIMRALGAAAGEIFGAVLIEAFWVTLLGIGAGWFVGTGLTYGLGAYLSERYGFAITAFRPSPDMVSAYSAVLLMGMVAGIVPAWQAYRTDIARDLSDV
ncbi:MAG: ABC transporter permease [Candidatus Hydrogenedentes bacterium]|nr:ABC transporter permease [Candidatus Hydrogenedentota bacterium]